jgi:hypothetical protein
MYMNVSASGQGLVVGSCDHGNEPSDTINVGCVIRSALVSSFCQGKQRDATERTLRNVHRARDFVTSCLPVEVPLSDCRLRFPRDYICSTAQKWIILLSSTHRVTAQLVLAVSLCHMCVLAGRSWKLLERPPVAQMRKNLPTFRVTRRSMTVFTRYIHWSLS